MISNRRDSQTRHKNDVSGSTPDMLAKLTRKKGQLIKDEILSGDNIYIYIYISELRTLHV